VRDAGQEGQERPPPAWIPGPIARRIAARPTLARFVGNVGWLVFERVLLMAVGVFVNVWFVRQMGPHDYGLYSYAVNYAALFTGLTTLSMDPILVRELARNPDAEGSILGTALVMRVGAAVVTWGAAAASIAMTQHEAPARGLVFVMGASALFQALGVFELWFQARIAARGVVLARVGANLGAHGIRALLLLLGAPLIAFAVLLVANAAAVAVAVGGLYARRRPASSRLHWQPALAKSLLHDAWPFIVVAMAITVYMRIDQVILSATMGARENGFYSSAAVLAELWHFIPVSIATSVLPLVVKARDTMDGAAFELRMQAVYDGMALIAYCIAIPITIFAVPLVQALYGEAYGRTADILVIKVWAFLFISLGTARNGFLVADNLTRFNMVATLLGATTSVLLNLALIPRFGGVGAAWATLASQGVSAYASGALDPRVHRQTWLMTRALLVPLRPQVLWRALGHPGPGGTS